MANFESFLKKHAKNVFWGSGDTDHPTCPSCGDTMDFYGGDDTPIGEGYWECSSCGYNFSEDDLQEYDV